MRGATLNRVIRTAADRERAAATDRDLLRRFADDGDQAAFEALVRRHTGLVLGVCRRALANAQDAEDACQATFLILARKARAGRWQPSVANWLFATARKVARDLRRAADRRARREGRAAVPEAVGPVDRMTGRELLAVIDEELDRLPPIYREPLLLYYQAELARDEIAARLGVPAGTVKIRLERGRKKLGDALTRRGVTLGAGLLALMATSRAGASPPRLVDAVRAAVAGDVPPAVAALAEGVAVNGFVKKAALGLVLAAAAAGVGFGIAEPRTTTAGPPPEKRTPAKPVAQGEKGRPADKPAEDKTRTITGKVLDPDGKPIAGAEIINLPLEGAVAVAGRTAADGTFRVTVPLKDPGSYLFPRVAGFAPDQFVMPATNTPAEVTFKAVKDTPIRGRVLDTQGKPVAGASVVVRSIQGFENDSLDAYLAGFQKRSGDGYPPSGKWWVSPRDGDRKLPAGDSVLAAATDKDGRFTIAGVGSERVAHLRLAGPGIATTDVVILTRDGFDPAPYNRETLEKMKSPYARLGDHPMLYSPDTALVAEAEKPIRGVVTDAATGKPRAGVKVTLRDQRNHRMPSLSATADARGRYEIHGAKKADVYEVSVRRDAEAGYIGRTVKATDSPAYEPVTLDVPTRKGIVLTGRLLDDRTGDPVRGFACVGVLYDNAAARARPEFDSPDCYDFDYTKADGVYRTVVPPGPVLLMAGPSPDGFHVNGQSQYEQMKTDPAYPDYFDKRLSGFRSPGQSTTMMQGQWCKVLKLKPNEAEVTIDVRFKRASQFAVRVRDADGKPVTGAVVAGNTARDWNTPATCETDACPVYELETVKPRFLAFLEPKRKLVGTLTLKGDEKEPAIVSLGPGGRVKGRLVDADGRPIAGAVVKLGYEHRAADEIDGHLHGDWRFGPAIETNAAGEFTIDVVIPGERFTVYGHKKDKFLEPPDRNAKVTVKAGEEKDLGTIRMKE